MDTRSVPPDVGRRVEVLWRTYDSMVKDHHVERFSIRADIEETYYELGYAVGRAASAMAQPKDR